ncbi:beta-lactamase family protein [Streptomyces sp. NBC_00876]|uniref:serine hydrolase domain-containing protein n=1 Tax=Streptomyces sp. NBC_00876 TaxID=2975853 RepID=UPI0038704244|nr:beta-lactamase family protein [Streptomyces sp. NBC_00876]
MIKHTRALAGSIALAVAAVVAVTAPPSSALTTVESTATRSAVTESTDAVGHTRLREILHRLTTVDGGPGALLEVRNGFGDVVLAGGVSNVGSQAPMDGDSSFRIGSMTKPFVATVMLQLVGEHRVELDAPVERYLPGIVRGHGNDGRVITVRQLLQHTSGLPDYLGSLNPQDVLKDPLAHYDARALVDIALANPPVFEKPGTEWSYSNTNYLLAGMIIEKVTGRTYGEEIQRRIIAPLGLHETSVPGDASAIPGPHPRGYARPGADAPLLDVTAINPSVAGAAGGMISSGTDMNRFLDALVRGELLRPAQLRQMMTTRPTGDPHGRAYGLGLESRRLPCGGRVWGHTGDVFGYETASGATVDGRQATVMVNLDPGGSDAQSDDMQRAIRTALCEKSPTAAR